jgi:hypothetical protein
VNEDYYDADEAEIEVFTITVRVYIDGDGRKQHDWEITGHCDVAEGLGALEAAKMQIWAAANEAAS